MNKEKMKGKTNEAAGETREHVGRAIGNDDMERKGHTQEMKGKVQSATGDLKAKVREVLD